MRVGDGSCHKPCLSRTDLPMTHGDTHRLFVYGTLRRGEANEFARYLHAHATHAGRARLRARLYAFGWFPGAVLSGDPADVVHGDLFALRPETAGEVIARLDEYEGFAFERREVEVETGPGERARCWTYLFTGAAAEGEPIASGDWLARRASG